MIYLSINYIKCIMDVCPICLDNMDDDEIIKTLSCDHKFHFSCFKKLVCHNNNFYY